MAYVNFAAVLLLMILLGTASATTNEYRLWIEPSAKKILQDALPSEQAPSAADLCAARNEWESFQICLRSNKTIRNIGAEASDLKQVKGKGVIPSTNIWLGLVSYVPIMNPPIPYPDPLPPLRPFDLQPNVTQPIWVTVKVPEGIPAGEYKGSIKVTAGRFTSNIAIKLHVWDFTLPKTPSCVTAFGITMESVARTHGATGSAEKTLELHKKYYEMLLDHKISPYHIPVDLMSPDAKAYLEDPRMTSYIIPYIEDDAKLKALVQYLIENNWFRKGYFYPLDEPVDKNAYDRLKQITDRLRAIEPRYRIVAPFFRGPDFAEGKTIWDFAIGQINIWCPNEHYFDLEPRTRLMIRARKNAGEDVWWYVCCGPGDPYSNFFVQQEAMKHRMLFWHQKREGVDGLLYWSTTYWMPWAGCDDPWKSMMTVKNINPNIFGDGSLLYPGKPVGIDGPVSSLRLEVIRDGIEDFEYLCLANNLLGSSATNQYIRTVAKSLTDYELDPLKLEKVRRRLGMAIEKAFQNKIN
ncbi:MAG: DUF6067 family protein [Armatimonadota bacterium]|nr:DUF6067 family protein [Armatimonadota bacterium]